MSEKWKENMKGLDKEKLKQEIKDKAEALQRKAKHLLKEGLISDAQFEVLQQKAKHIPKEGLISDEQFASLREKTKHVLQDSLSNRAQKQDDEKNPRFGFIKNFSLKRLLWKCTFSFFAFIAVVAIYKQTEMDMMALSRIDPVPHAQELVVEKRFAEAALYLGYFMEFDYVKDDPQAVELYTQIENERSSWWYNLKKIGEGLIKGESDETIGNTTAIVSDFLVIGDIRDLGIEGWKYVKGEEVDEVEVTLSGISVAATGAQIVSGASTAATGGAAAPTVVVSTASKASIAMLKVAKKLGKLPKWLLKSIKDAAVAAKSRKGIHNLNILFQELNELAATKGGLDLLYETTDAVSLKEMAEFSSRFKDGSLIMFQLGGKKIIQASKITQNDYAVKVASTYGKTGVELLNKKGAIEFMHFLPKDREVAKISWKQRASLVLPSLFNKLLPTWALYVLAFSGIAIWLPMKRWTIAALRKLAGKIPFLRNRLETEDADVA